MPLVVFANLAASTTVGPITSGATSVTVVPGDGAEFPNPSAGQYFIATFEDSATELQNEIVFVTARSGDTMTIMRGQEGTAPVAWNAGSLFKMLITAGTMRALSQVVQTQAGSANSAIDTGTVNSYAATFAPAITARIPGMVLRVLAANANTGPSTLNAGAGSAPIINPDGSPVGVGAIIAGGYFEVVDDGVSYELISANSQAGSNSGLASVGDYKWRPDASNQTGWLFANGTTLGNAASGASQRANADCANLFGFLWATYSNTKCPVFTSAGVPTTRGANAVADFAANKRIQNISMICKGPMGVDGMGGAPVTNGFSGVPFLNGDGNTPGSDCGENVHTITVAELPSHTHSGTTSTETALHSHGVSATTTGVSADHSHTGSGTTSTESVYHQHTGSGTTGNENAAHSHTGSGGTAGQTVGHTHSGGGTTSIESANHTHTGSGTTGGADHDHTHNGSGTTTGESADHSHIGSGNTGTMSANNVHNHTYNQTAPGGSFGVQNFAGNYVNFNTTTTTNAVDLNHQHAFGFTTSGASNDHSHNFAFNTSGQSFGHAHAFGFTTSGVSANHTHTYSFVTSDVSNDHSHAFSFTTGTESAVHAHSYSFTTSNQTALHTHSYSFVTSGQSNDHTHSFSVQSTTESAVHAHTYVTDGGTGGNGSHNTVQKSVLGSWYVKL